jgi:hypothetical protein
MQDDQVEEHLTSAAAKGVDVQVVMSLGQTGKDANAPGLQKIQAGGVMTCLVKSPYIHAKIIVADNSSSFVGSENFSPTSLDHNRELGILTQDPGVISQLTASFEKDWSGYIGVKQGIVQTGNHRLPGLRHLSLRPLLKKNKPNKPLPPPAFTAPASGWQLILISSLGSKRILRTYLSPSRAGTQGYLLFVPFKILETTSRFFFCSLHNQSQKPLSVLLLQHGCGTRARSGLRRKQKATRAKSQPLRKAL